MSIDIIYDKRFIRTGRGVIPMVLIGSSNCYDTIWDSRGRRREVRERHWSMIHDMMLEDPIGQEKWLSMVEANPDSQLFKERKNWITGENVRKWFENGVSSSCSLEDYLKWNPTQSCICQIIWYKDKSSTIRNSEYLRYCHNTKELEDWIDGAKKLREALYIDIPTAAVYLKIGFDGTTALRSVPKTDGPVIAKRGNNGYVSAYETGKSRTFTDDPEKAHVFANIDEAIKELGMTPGGHGIWNKVTFVSAKTVDKGRPWIVQIGTPSYRAGWYIQKITKRRIFTTLEADRACKYASKASACKAADKAGTKFHIGIGEHRFILCNTQDGTETEYLVGSKS